MHGDYPHGYFSKIHVYIKVIYSVLGDSEDAIVREERKDRHFLMLLLTEPNIILSQTNNGPFNILFPFRVALVDVSRRAQWYIIFSGIFNNQ